MTMRRPTQRCQPAAPLPPDSRGRTNTRRSRDYLLLHREQKVAGVGGLGLGRGRFLLVSRSMEGAREAPIPTTATTAMTMILQQGVAQPPNPRSTTRLTCRCALGVGVTSAGGLWPGGLPGSAV